MKILLLGCGKTGSLVAEVIRERGHDLQILRARDNPRGVALRAGFLREFDVVIDFTSPEAAVNNIEACVKAGKNMVVGTTGWHDELNRVRRLVDAAGTGFVFGSNFSIGVNVFFEIARVASVAMKHGYFAQIFERHHTHKKDAPSGTALSLQEILKVASGTEVEITSFREGEVVGMHELTLDSPNDNIYLCHDSKSRRGFAEGAARAAEWIAGQKGFYDFRNVWPKL